MKIDPADLRVDIYRMPGYGVDTPCICVRIEHKPTGIVVKSEERASHSVNMDRALEELKKKLKAPAPDAGVGGEESE